MTTDLTAQQILFIHARLITTIGGEHGVRDLGMLEAAAARPQPTFDGKELYPGLFLKAAALMESLAKNHPFVDGNKRTAITAVALFLLRNGYRLETANDELERFTFQVVEARPSLADVAAWLQTNTQKLDETE